MGGALYKDMAKWLIGFVPVTALAGLGVALAPNADVIARLGLSEWMSEHAWAVGGVAAVVIATLVMVVMCARVLLAEPTGWVELTQNSKWMEAAFAKYSVGRPHFFDLTEFSNAELASHTNPQDKRATAVAETTARVVTLSGDLNAKHRLKVFLWVFAFGTVAVIAGVLVVLVNTSTAPDVIVRPTPVVLHVPASSETAFDSATGCRASSSADAVAVGGSPDVPDLRLFGRGCRADTWKPSADLHVVVTQP